MSRFMFDDRLFIPMPYFNKHCPFSLLTRIIVANRWKEQPFDLSRFIDERSLQAAEPQENAKLYIASPGHPWAFYIPKKSCPLDYRSLALWFRLFCLMPDGKPCKQGFLGLGKLLGLDRRTIEAHAEILHQKHDLIKVVKSDDPKAPWWWFVPPVRDECRSWFVEVTTKKDSAMPDEMRKIYEQFWPEQKTENPPQTDSPSKDEKLCYDPDNPEEVLAMLDTSIPKHLKQWGCTPIVKKYFNAPGHCPVYDDKDKAIVEKALKKIKERERAKHEQRNEPNEPEQQNSIDFIEGLRTL